MARVGVDDRGRTPRTAREPLGTAVLALALVLAVPGRAPAVRDQDEGAAAAIPVDATGLASGPYASLEMVYERTIFRVDVLRLTLRFGAQTAAELEHLVDGRQYTDELAESVVRAAVESQDLLVRSRFLRDVSLEQFLDGIRENMEHARDAGFLSSEEVRTLLPEIEAQYEPIRDRGIRDGETMWYRIRGDTLHVAFQALDGSVLIDRRQEGSEHRRAVLGGYLAPGSDFREDLSRSLF